MQGSVASTDHRPPTKADVQAVANGFQEVGRCRLNAEQRLAVASVMSRAGVDMPFALFGPPGTGKTVTLVECALQVSHQGVLDVCELMGSKSSQPSSASVLSLLAMLLLSHQETFIRGLRLPRTRLAHLQAGEWQPTGPCQPRIHGLLGLLTGSRCLSPLQKSCLAVIPASLCHCVTSSRCALLGLLFLKKTLASLETIFK